MSGNTGGSGINIPIPGLGQSVINAGKAAGSAIGGFFSGMFNNGGGGNSSPFYSPRAIPNTPMFLPDGRQLNYTAPTTQIPGSSGSGSGSSGGRANVTYSDAPVDVFEGGYSGINISAQNRRVPDQAFRIHDSSFADHGYRSNMGQKQGQNSLFPTASIPGMPGNNNNTGMQNNFQIGNAVQQGGMPLGMIPVTSNYSSPGINRNFPTGFGPANNYGAGAFGIPGVGSYSSSGSSANLGFNFSGNDKKLLESLNKMYGEGVGSTLLNYMKGGAGYSDATTQAMINEALPQYYRGIAAIQDSFGAAGLRFSSTAGLGLSDYAAQFSGSINSAIAQQREAAQGRIFSILSGIRSDAFKNEAGGAGAWQNLIGLASQIIGRKVNPGNASQIPGAVKNFFGGGSIWGGN